MKFILGTKEHMTQVFDEGGKVRAATVLRVPKTVISQVKTAETDGYEAVQVAAGETKESRVSKAERGARGGAYRYAREYRPRRRGESIEGAEKGETLDVTAFAIGDRVEVSAVSKGKGFQGVVKRHGFAGGPASHGQKHSLRAPGAIGIGGIQRVLKGTRMAGRMGAERITVKNLSVLAIDPEENLLIVSGAVPGRRGSLVEVRG